MAIWATGPDIGDDMKPIIYDSSNANKQIIREAKMKSNIIATIISGLILLGTLISYFSKSESRMAVLEEQNKTVISLLQKQDTTYIGLSQKLDMTLQTINNVRVDVATNTAKIESMKK